MLDRNPARGTMFDTPLVRIWFAFVAAWVAWLILAQSTGHASIVATIHSLDAWAVANLVDSAWWIRGDTAVVVAVAISALLILRIAAVIGRVFMYAVLHRRWIATLFLLTVCLLDWQAMLWIALGSSVALSIGYIVVSKGIGHGLMGVSIWTRIAYAVSFALVFWLACGFTAEARNYPTVVADFVMNQVPQQWLFGYWIPYIALGGLVYVAAWIAYVVGGYFFNYLARHWIGPVSLAIVLGVLTPADRFLELLLIVWNSGVFTVFSQTLAFGLVVACIYAVVKALAHTDRRAERDYRWIALHTFEAYRAPYSSAQNCLLRDAISPSR